MNNLVFGKPFLLYHSGQSPRPCCRILGVPFLSMSWLGAFSLEAAGFLLEAPVKMCVARRRIPAFPAVPNQFQPSTSPNRDPDYKLKPNTQTSRETNRAHALTTTPKQKGRKNRGGKKKHPPQTENREEGNNHTPSRFLRAVFYAPLTAKFPPWRALRSGRSGSAWTCPSMPTWRRKRWAAVSRKMRQSQTRTAFFVFLLSKITGPS